MNFLCKIGIHRWLISGWYRTGVDIASYYIGNKEVARVPYDFNKELPPRDRICKKCHKFQIEIIPQQINGIGGNPYWVNL